MSVCVTDFVFHAALLIWHHLLTFDREVAFFWKRKFSGASGLFFANRYLILVYSIYNLLWEPLKASNVVSSTSSMHASFPMLMKYVYMKG